MFNGLDTFIMPPRRSLMSDIKVRLIHVGSDALFFLPNSVIINVFEKS